MKDKQLSSADTYNKSLLLNFLMAGVGVLVSTIGYLATLEDHFIITNVLFFCTELLIKSIHDISIDLSKVDNYE